MLKDHLRRTVRLSKPSLSTTSRRKSYHFAYIFLCLVITIIVALLVVFYDFSIHQPSIDFDNDNETPGDVIIDRNLLKDGITNTNTNKSNDENKYKEAPNDVFNPIAIEQWPLETSKCSATFGNGFSKEIIQCSTDLSSFKCIQNPFSNQMYCRATNFIINPSMIRVSNGGEEINAVAGRKEDDEFPQFKADADTGDTAFNVDCEPQGNIPRKDGTSYYMHDIIHFMRDHAFDDRNSAFHSKYISQYNELCKDTDITTIFLLTMRYEYANLYHQMTDWYNFYQIIHSLGIEDNYQIVFFDGHAMSQIDDAWRYGINTQYHFIKQINNGQAICMKNAIFVSAGYVGGISLQTQLKGCAQESKYVTMFAPWFLSGFGIERKTERKDKKISITLVCREDYVAHPRNLVGRATRKFRNIEGVMNKIRDAVKGFDDLEFNMRNVAWSDYTFKEQLEIAATTDIMIGVHGAGLSHVLFLPAKSGLIEILPSGYEGEPHFWALSTWAGHAYDRVRGGSENNVDPATHELTNAINTQIIFLKRNIY